MDRKHINPFRAPWRNGNGLSCSVFDAHGGLVATLYANTHDEQRKRLHLVRTAPALLDTLRQVITAARDVIEDTEARELAELLDRAETLLQEAEPV